MQIKHILNSVVGVIVKHVGSIKDFSSIMKDTFQIVIIVWYYCCLIGVEKQSIENRYIFANA